MNAFSSGINIDSPSDQEVAEIEKAEGGVIGAICREVMRLRAQEKERKRIHCLDYGHWFYEGLCKKCGERFGH